jgi:beta-glucanase (GH16 family)
VRSAPLSPVHPAERERKLTASNPPDCPDDPALAGTYDHKYGNAAPDFKTTAGSDVIKYGGADGAIFRVEKKLDAPTIVSDFYIMWGKLEVSMKAAPGGGVVSSVVLQSDNLDEIDWEWVGSKPGEAQSNYFGKGNTDSYDRGAVHPVDSQSGFHTYGFEWTAEKLDWLIDGVVVRTLIPSEVKGDYYPQTPMQVRLGSWAAGDEDNEEGTVRKFFTVAPCPGVRSDKIIEWSGGPINYKEGPFDMVVKEIKVVDYSTGTAYRYGDKSGRWESIIAVDGTVGAGPQSGKGNAGNLATSSSSSKPSSTSRPSGGNSKTGVLIPTTGTATKTSSYSEPTSDSGNSKGADSTESTHSPTSPSSPSVSGSANDEVTFEGGGNKSGALSGFIVYAAGLVSGWLLI